MQEVDARALEHISRIAGASTAGAQITEFQDELLQQVLDVSRMVPGDGLNDGWVSISNQQSHTANGNLFSTVDLYDTIVRARGLSVEQYRVWVMHCHLQRECSPADGSISDMFSAVQFRGLVLPVSHVFSFSGAPLQSGGTFCPGVAAGASVTPPPLRTIPIPLLPGGDVLLERSTSTGIAVAGPVRAQFNWVVWVGVRGQLPPGVA